MEASSYAVVLCERLGNDGYEALEEMIRVSHANLVTIAHFDRRLSEECTALRQEIGQGHAALRLEMREGDAALRQGMTEGLGALRQEMTEGHAALRREMAEGDTALRLEIAGLRQDILAGRFDLLKWCFAFWVGQLVSVVGIVALMLQFMRP